MLLTSDRETTETPLLLKSFSFANSGVGVNDDRVVDETVLVSLDLADHVGLSLGGAVVVNNTKTTLESHVDGHLVFRDSVHRRRDEGGSESDALGDGRFKADLRGSEANVAREEQEVVVGQTTVLGCVHKLMDVETIPLLVLLENLKGLGVVKH